MQSFSSSITSWHVLTCLLGKDSELSLLIVAFCVSGGSFKVGKFNTCRCGGLMSVPVSQALEFGIILNAILRKEPPVQIPFITWILMLRHVNMLNYYLMTKYLFFFSLTNLSFLRF